MKIGIVTPGGFDRSGTDRVIPVFLWLVERLARRHEVHVFTLNQYPGPETYRLVGATVHNIGHRGLNRRSALQMLSTISAIRREHGKARFDILHGLWADISGLTAVVAGRLLRVPSVVTVAGGELVSRPEIGYGGSRTRKGRTLVGLTLRLATAVTSAAEYTRREVMKRRPDAKLIVLGTDVRRFTPPESDCQGEHTEQLPGIPSQLSTPGPPWRIIHVASLNRVKDQPTLLRAFRAIHDVEPATYLDVIGEDTLNGQIQRLASELGLGDAVTFHGFQTSNAVAGMLQKAHILMHTSLFEDAGPLTFLEASACGVPTVGTAVGLIADLASTCAVATPVGDHAALAREVLTLLRDNSARIALGQRALAYARSNDADWTAAQFEALYNELTSRR